MTDLRSLQAEVDLWQRETFPEHGSLSVKALVVVEEVGEVAEAVVELLDVTRSADWLLEDSRSALGDEIADVVISIAGLASLAGIDLEAAVLRKWQEVRARTEKP